MPNAKQHLLTRQTFVLGAGASITYISPLFMSLPHGWRKNSHLIH